MEQPNTSLNEFINILAELTVFNQYNFNQFLKKFILAINQIIPADSCFIYVYDKEQKKYILAASKKEHPQINMIALEEGEGITGWVAEHKKTVMIQKKAYQDPRFKTFQQLPEDKYESFLSVPVTNKTGIIGVINIQNSLPYKFTSQEVHAIESLVKIVSSAFSSVLLERKINSLQTQLEERKIIEKAKGVLMKAKNISEEEAFKFIRTEAMNKRKSNRQIAEAILLVF